MKRRIWLLALCVYAVVGIVDGASRLTVARHAAGGKTPPAAVAVAFCAGLFWPLDIPARVFLAAR